MLALKTKNYGYICLWFVKSNKINEIHMTTTTELPIHMLFVMYETLKQAYPGLPVATLLLWSIIDWHCCSAVTVEWKCTTGINLVNPQLIKINSLKTFILKFGSEINRKKDSTTKLVHPLTRGCVAFWRLHLSYELVKMRPLTDEETKTMFEKLSK